MLLPVRSVSERILPCSETERKLGGVAGRRVRRMSAENAELVRLVQSDDPRIALEALRRLREFSEQHERRAVAAARRAGLSWQEIAETLGRQKSSVWEHYHDGVDD